MSRAFPNLALQRPFFRPQFNARERTYDNDLIYPILPSKGGLESRLRDAGHERLTIDELTRECEEVAKLGIPAVALFSTWIAACEPKMVEAHNPNGLVPRAVAAVKAAVPELGVITDAAPDLIRATGTTEF